MRSGESAPASLLSCCDEGWAKGEGGALLTRKQLAHLWHRPNGSEGPLDRVTACCHVANELPPALAHSLLHIPAWTCTGTKLLNPAAPMRAALVQVTNLRGVEYIQVLPGLSMSWRRRECLRAC